jgi:two-component system response regulator HydG
MSQMSHFNESLFAALLGSVRDGVFIVDRNWKVIAMNAVAERLTGYALGDWRDRLCRNLFRTDSCGEKCPMFTALEQGAPVLDRRVVLTCKDGQPMDTLVNCMEFKDERGESAGGVVVLRSISVSNRLPELLQGEDQFEGIVGRDRSMLELYEQIQQVADLDSTVLITGESGTGKELVANALVHRSKRRDKPFIKVNCGVLSEHLLESELFGHVRGAFTGAYADHPGRFELADAGTLLLDEIGEASPGVQLKLLRVLQEREFERVGGTETIRIDVRVIAATNRDLRQLIPVGKFREDLFYRLSAVPIELPPLRSRGNDVLLLVQHLFDKLKQKTGFGKAQLSDEAIERLIHYPWPGNVRQLENALEYSLIRARGGVIMLNHLPAEMREQFPAAGVAMEDEHSERARLLRALHEAQWNRQRASERLGISRTTLWRLMRRHRMQEP